MVFRDDTDRDIFVDRLSDLLPETQTACYAWAFILSHAHFLFRSGAAGISALMRRPLTGYAVYFNLHILAKSFRNQKKDYLSSVEKGVDQGRKPELTGVD